LIRSVLLYLYHIYVYIYTHIWIYIYVFYQFICVLWRTWFCSYTHVYDYIVAHIYIYICIYVYVYVYIYIYIYTYTHTYTYVLWIHHPYSRSPCQVATSPVSSVWSRKHVRWQFFPESSEWTRTHWCSSDHQWYEVGCFSADRVLLTISCMKSPVYPFSPTYAPQSSSTKIYMMSVSITTLVTTTVITNCFV